MPIAAHTLVAWSVTASPTSGSVPVALMTVGWSTRLHMANGKWVVRRLLPAPYGPGRGYVLYDREYVNIFHGKGLKAVKAGALAL